MIVKVFYYVSGWPAGGQLRVWVWRVLRDAAGDVRRRGDHQHHAAAEPQVPTQISTNIYPVVDIYY